MKVKSLSSSARFIAATGQTVEPGATVDVPNDVGRDLVKQPDRWEAVKSNKEGDR